jgi:acetyl esterase/lipase
LHHRRIADWDDAYANGPNIPRGEAWPDAWVGPARTARERLLAQGRARLDVAYGGKPRNRLDLFLPDGEPKGLVVYVHGGFWMRLDKSFWSHLAEGALRSGFAVAFPGYTLCPDVRIRDITVETGAAIAAAAGMVAGPLHLVGHSAGGHLVTRMACAGAPLPADVQARVAGVLSISGLHDLRPLMATAMNALLKLDEAEAAAESPALLRPAAGVRLTCWVGASERAEFVRQNALLANVWTGLGAAVACVEEPDRHHFNVVDGLADPDHPLTRALLTSG